MNTNNLPPVKEPKENSAASHRHKYTLLEYLDVYSRFSNRKKRNRKKTAEEEKLMADEIKPKVNNEPPSSVQMQKIFVIIMIFVCTALILATLVIFAASSFISPMFNTVFFMSFLVIFFYNTEFIQNIAQTLGATNPIMFMALFAGIQGIGEAIVCCIVAGIISKTLYKVVNK